MANQGFKGRRLVVRGVCLAALLSAGQPAAAVVMSWPDWTSAGGTAAGTISLPASARSE